MSDRLVAPAATAEDSEGSLRPRRLAEFIGQQQLRTNLAVFVDAARARGETGFGAQWAGQGAPLARFMPAADLVYVLEAERLDDAG